MPWRCAGIEAKTGCRARNRLAGRADITRGWAASTARPNLYQRFVDHVSRPRAGSDSPTDRQSVQVGKFVGKGFGPNVIMCFLSASWKLTSALGRASATDSRAIAASTFRLSLAHVQPRTTALT